MADDFQVRGKTQAAPFELTIHRGDGMALLAMNWKKGEPPVDFIGFAIEYKEPEGKRFFALTNRLTFAGAPAGTKRASSRNAPFQKFRWVHFPRNAELAGSFEYRVTPVFMNEDDELSFGEAQTAAIELRRETHPGQLNVSYTRGFVSSQAFVDRYAAEGAISKLLPGKAKNGLNFTPSHSEADEALAWMGFEATHAILELLDQAIADDQSSVRVVAYDLNLPSVVTRLEELGDRLQLIIDDDGPHGESGSAENQAEKRIVASAGRDNVKRQHMGKLQHNKFIVVDGPKVKAALCGSTNFSWRGFFVQSNNALIVRGKQAIAPFLSAFDEYWQHDTPGEFGKTRSAKWTSLGLSGIDARVAFSPHAPDNALLAKIASDVEKKTTSSLLYSLAFLYQIPGAMLNAIKTVTKRKDRFVYGISDRKVGGITLQKPDGNLAPVFSAALTRGKLPEPFKSEPSGGGGIRMHHKFLVIDFDKPSARVCLGSYNFSVPADTKNGENLLLIRDRRVAVSYMIEALRIFDHYHFRVAQLQAKKAKKKLELKKPPRKRGEKPWWSEYYVDARKIRDRELFM